MICRIFGWCEWIIFLMCLHFVFTRLNKFFWGSTEAHRQLQFQYNFIFSNRAIIDKKEFCQWKPCPCNSLVNDTYPKIFLAFRQLPALNSKYYPIFTSTKFHFSHQLCIVWLEFTWHSKLIIQFSINYPIRLLSLFSSSSITSCIKGIQARPQSPQVDLSSPRWQFWEKLRKRLWIHSMRFLFMDSFSWWSGARISLNVWSGWSASASACTASTHWAWTLGTDTRRTQQL